MQSLNTTLLIIGGGPGDNGVRAERLAFRRFWSDNRWAALAEHRLHPVESVDSCG